MKILSSFTHPQAFLSSAEHIDFHGSQISSPEILKGIVPFKRHHGSQWLQLTVWLSTFFKISSFVFSRRKKCIQVWNNLRVS